MDLIDEGTPVNVSHDALRLESKTASAILLNKHRKGGVAIIFEPSATTAAMTISKAPKLSTNGASVRLPHHGFQPPNSTDSFRENPNQLTATYGDVVAHEGTMG